MKSQINGLRRWRTSGVAVLAAVVLGASMASAAGPKVLAQGKLPEDKRLAPLKDLNGYFPFAPPSDAHTWQQQAEFLRRRVLVSQGLVPMPSKTPLNAVVHGRIEQADYTVEKAYFESLPGFFVTGNLYRPKKAPASGKCPGVLCPHGHWSNGRFTDAGQAAVRKDIVNGAERFENGGRSPLQARCVTLARMGCVVFHYDMIGYADSVQITQKLAHGFAKQRAEMSTSENWGLFSPQAESHLQSVMGLQTLSSIRALDFLSALPDVDPSRIAVTGASGGGTQTFMIAAIDPRVQVAVPAVMVSTAMQGGCTCENASLLRVDSGNIHLAGLFAPKPQLLLSADDWTKEMDTKGFPELKKLYELLGAGKNVSMKMLRHFGHNYNYVSRSAMYDWVNTHLKLGLPAPIVEEDYARLSPEQMSVWDDAHPKPAGGDDVERRLLRWWHEDSQKQLDALVPANAEGLAKYKQTVDGAVDVLVGRHLPAGDGIAFAETSAADASYGKCIAGLLNVKADGAQLPVVVLQPRQAPSRVVVWLSKDGKAGLFQDDGQPKPAVRKLLDGGAAVLGVDLIYQGEFLADGKPLDRTPRVANPREAAAYTFGYNHTVFAQRVHDVLAALALARQRAGSKPVCLAGLDGAGAWAAAARAVARIAAERAAIDTAGFRFARVNDIHSPDFQPGGAKYHDLPGMLAVVAPAPLWLAGEGKEGPAVARAAYKAAGAEAGMTVYSGEQAAAADAAADWLLTP